MSKILPQYSYNVPKGKTHWKGKKYTGGQYGMCPRECDNVLHSVISARGAILSIASTNTARENSVTSVS